MNKYTNIIEDICICDKSNKTTRVKTNHKPLLSLNISRSRVAILGSSLSTSRLNTKYSNITKRDAKKKAKYIFVSIVSTLLSINKFFFS